MKRTLYAVATLLLLATPLFAVDDTTAARPAPAPVDRDRTTIIDDVIRMSQSGVEDDVIVKFIRDSRERYVVNADVIIALTEAKVSKPVLEAVMDNADRRVDGRDTRRETRTVYVAPYYDPFWCPRIYDPWWYYPRYSIGIGWGWGGRGHYGGGRSGGHRGGRRH